MSLNIFLPGVTRIPITGPKPFNTLVCVTSFGDSWGADEPGQLRRFSGTAVSTFRLEGFDQRVKPIFNHSTSIWLGRIGPTETCNWVYAIDSVTGAGFEPVFGVYFVTFDVGTMIGRKPFKSPAAQEIFGFIPQYGYYICSYVLCFEPPLQNDDVRMNQGDYSGIGSENSKIKGSSPIVRTESKKIAHSLASMRYS